MERIYILIASMSIALPASYLLVGLAAHIYEKVSRKPLGVGAFALILPITFLTTILTVFVYKVLVKLRKQTMQTDHH